METNDRSDHCDSHSMRSCVFGLAVTFLRRGVKLKTVQLLTTACCLWTKQRVPCERRLTLHFFPLSTYYDNNKQRKHHSHMQRSLSSCWAGIEWSRHVPDSANRAWAFPARRRAPRQMEVESKNSSGSSTDCRVWVWTVYSRNPRELRNVHTPPPASPSLSIPPWLSEWAQLKATGDALCVRECARTASQTCVTSPLTFKNLE